MIKRTLQEALLRLRKQFPILALLGPRQSGKTTLAKALFPEYRYVNLEIFEEQEFAREDARGFLLRFQGSEGVILDEIQKAPKLLSYLQVDVDENPKNGRYILTGSQNILLNHQISQTLAGRVALTTLLPLSIHELRDANRLPKTMAEAIFKGFYPRLHQSHQDPVVFAESYLRTYVERDVRDIKQIQSLSEFQKFMRFCAARVGQLLNLSALATESGLSLPTVKAWISILEATYIIFLLHPYHVHFNKRLTKMPKLYFYDTSLACHLLRLTKQEDIWDHYLKGGLFESMILSDLLKERYHHCLPPNLYFWRDKVGNEIDCVSEEGSKITPIEIKSSATFSSNMFEGLQRWQALAKSELSLQKGLLIYGGEEEYDRKEGKAMPWRAI